MHIGAFVTLAVALLLAPAAGHAKSLPNCDLTSYPLAPAGGRQMKKANLAGCDLSGAMLAGADMRRADLTGAILDEADLSGANLARATSPARHSTPHT
jgi:hypothetical protein